MARQSRSGGGSRPTRPTVAPRAAPAPQRQQTRPSSTAAAPANSQRAAPPAAAAPAAAAPSQGPGLFANMASTAAGVAVGSTIGHALGGFFGGGSSEAPAAAAQDSGMTNAQAAPAEQNNWQARNCDVDAKQFTKCLDENQGNMQTCSWYLEQLKQCQAASAGY